MLHVTSFNVANQIFIVLIPLSSHILEKKFVIYLTPAFNALLDELGLSKIGGAKKKGPILLQSQSEQCSGFGEGLGLSCFDTVSNICKISATRESSLEFPA